MSARLRSSRDGGVRRKHALRPAVQKREEEGEWSLDGTTFKMTTMEKETETLKSCRVFFWFQHQR